MRGLDDHLSIGERIAFYRERRGYTQPVLAGLVGHSTDWLSKIERGVRRPPRIDKLAELARVLRVPLGDLMGQPVLLEDGEKHMDDVPAVRDALMSLDGSPSFCSVPRRSGSCRDRSRRRSSSSGAGASTRLAFLATSSLPCPVC